jgi:hypothetical protein
MYLCLGNEGVVHPKIWVDSSVWYAAYDDLSCSTIFMEYSFSFLQIDSAWSFAPCGAGLDLFCTSGWGESGILRLFLLTEVPVELSPM